MPAIMTPRESAHAADLTFYHLMNGINVKPEPFTVMLERMEGKIETVQKIVGGVRCGYSIHGLFPWSSYPRAASHVSGSRRAKTPCVYDKRKGKPFSLLNEGLVNSCAMHGMEHGTGRAWWTCQKWSMVFIGTLS